MRDDIKELLRDKLFLHHSILGTAQVRKSTHSTGSHKNGDRSTLKAEPSPHQTDLDTLQFRPFTDHSIR